MSQDDIFGKIDTLLAKRQADTAASADAKNDLVPDLEIAPDMIPVLTEALDEGEETPFAQKSAAAFPRPEATPPPAENVSASDLLAEQVLRIVNQRLQEMLERSVAPQLSSMLDKALADMFEHFGSHIEYLVREATAKELQNQLHPASPFPGGAQDTSTAPGNPDSHTGDTV